MFSKLQKITTTHDKQNDLPSILTRHTDHPFSDFPGGGVNQAHKASRGLRILTGRSEAEEGRPNRSRPTGMENEGDKVVRKIAEDIHSLGKGSSTLERTKWKGGRGVGGIKRVPLCVAIGQLW